MTEGLPGIHGRVLAVNISAKKGVVKESLPEGFFQADHGLVGDAHAGKWHRQVSLLANESVDKLRHQAVQGLCAGSFAENLTTENILLHELPVGTRLRIGETIQEVTQIGKECHNECAIKRQVGRCVMPTEGIFTRVLQAGRIRPGDSIEEVFES